MPEYTLAMLQLPPIPYTPAKPAFCLACYVKYWQGISSLSLPLSPSQLHFAAVDFKFIFINVLPVCGETKGGGEGVSCGRVVRFCSLRCTTCGMSDI